MKRQLQVEWETTFVDVLKILKNFLPVLRVNLVFSVSSVNILVASFRGKLKH